VESHERPSGSSRSRDEEDVVVLEIVVHVESYWKRAGAYGYARSSTD
jgi:hypothetical protein